MQSGRAQKLLRSFLHILVRNWPFKILSLLLAIILWAGLITQDPTLTREKTFTDVPVTISGAEALKRSGFIVVSDLNSALQNVSFTVDVPQQQYSNVTYSNYSLRLDLSRISETGEQELRFGATSTSTYGTVTQISPASVTVNVEEYITRYRVPVSLTTVGEMAEGFYAETPTADPSIVTVSGPASLVNRVVRAEATLDLSSLPGEDGEVLTTVPFVLRDIQGNEVVSDLIEVTSESVLVDSVIVDVEVHPMKELSLSEIGLTTGTVAAGYELLSVTVEPHTVLAAGNADALANLETLFVDSAIDISGWTETTAQSIRIRRPSGIVYLSSDSATVTVKIAEVITQRSFERLRIGTTGNDRSVAVVLDTSVASVTLTAPQLFLEKLRNGQVSLSVDVTDLPVGEYDLPLQVHIDTEEEADWLAVTEPETVHVTITGR